MIKIDRRCPARRVRAAADPNHATVFRPRVAVDAFVLKYQKPL
jgi:hypothetical protein